MGSLKVLGCWGWGCVSLLPDPATAPAPAPANAPFNYKVTFVLANRAKFTFLKSFSSNEQRLWDGVFRPLPTF